MGRFGRAAAWRNMALYGTLDETRHGQIQTYFPPYGLLAKEPRADWAHKAFHTNEWGGARRPQPVRRHVRRERCGVHRDPADLHLRDRLHQPAVPGHGGRRDAGRRRGLRFAYLLDSDRRGTALPAG